MYVVRITLPDREPDFKAFSSRHDATRRFNAATGCCGDQIDGVTLFEVPDVEDARQAIVAVKSGNAKIQNRDLYADLQRAAEQMVEAWIAEGRISLSTQHAQ